MNEIDLINKITNILKSKYIGDDCAYLKDLNIVITQDSLVENVHFRLDLITPYQLGYKSIMVNLSDVAASGACPKYATISLSIPKKLNEDYVEEFYCGAKFAADKYDVEIVGGDITASDKLFISVSAIGDTKGRYISSRSNAKIGQKIITISEHGSSAAGLRILLEGLEYNEELVNSHLLPCAKVEFAKSISENIKEDYAMMDTSDGLFDAVYKIGNASNCTMKLDFDKIKYNPLIETYFKDYKDLIFYGGEDYQIIATVPEDLLASLEDYIIIGEVIPKEDCVIKLKDKNEIIKYSNIQDKCFNHF